MRAVLSRELSGLAKYVSSKSHSRLDNGRCMKECCR